MSSPTFSHVATPADPRCQWWQKIAGGAEVQGAALANVEGAQTLPGGKFARKGSDHELPIWTVIFDGEAIHHRKQRGWAHQVGIVIPVITLDVDVESAEALALGASIVWIKPGAPHKAHIKATAGDMLDALMVGSGPCAAILRAAQWVLAGATDQERIERAMVLSKME